MRDWYIALGWDMREKVDFAHWLCKGPPIIKPYHSFSFNSSRKRLLDVQVWKRRTYALSDFTKSRMMIPVTGKPKLQPLISSLHVFHLSQTSFAIFFGIVFILTLILVLVENPQFSMQYFSHTNIIKGFINFHCFQLFFLFFSSFLCLVYFY